MQADVITGDFRITYWIMLHRISSITFFNNQPNKTILFLSLFLSQYNIIFCNQFPSKPFKLIVQVSIFSVKYF